MVWTEPKPARQASTSEGPVVDLSDPDRLASLARSRLLDSPPEESFDRLTRLAARVLGAKVSLVTLLDNQRQFLKSTFGVSGELAVTRETPLSHSYCRHVVQSVRPLVVKDAREHPLLRGNPAIDEYGAIAYCGVPITDPDGHPLGSLCVVEGEPREWTPDEVAALTDIAASAIAEVSLRYLAEDLAAANGTLRDIIATTSHDVRNPLSVILGFARILREDPDVSSTERREFAEFIHQAASQANSLISDLLEVSKLEAGVLEPHPALLDLPALIEAEQRRNPAWADDVFCHVADGVTVFADPHHVQRILVNLISNARKYGSPPVVIDAKSVADRTLITVTDHGPGVPAAFVPRLFEKFARSEDARSSDIEGTGLGLTIVAGLARANQGTIWYQDNEPSGSQFVVELPLGVRE